MIEGGVSPEVQSQPRRSVGPMAGTIDVRMHCTRSAANADCKASHDPLSRATAVR
jgi:hypothetical protein